MPPTVPTWGLTTAYWLHMLATVLWIGSLAALAVVVLPAAGRALAPYAYASLLEHVQRRLEPLGWFCLLVLVGTGLFQMSASPNYRGFLAIDNPWAMAILVKHLVFLIMIGVSAWSTWGILPALRRAMMRAAKESAVAKELAGTRGDTPSKNEVHSKGLAEVLGLQRRSLLLLRINLVFSILVLGLTALARVL